MSRPLSHRPATSPSQTGASSLTDSHIPPARPATSRPLFERLTGEDSLDPKESRNGLRIAASLSMTKISDGLIDPKLVLGWLLTALGAPAAFTGALVPIREAGALLPQLLLAGGLRRLTRKKWMWVAGAAIQGVAALLIALGALFLQGAAAGLAICAALALLALARAACSVSFKTVLGKMVGKTRRGAVTGIAGSLASGAVVVFALLLISGLFESRGPVLIAITLAGALWLGAAMLFSTLSEDPAEAQEQATPPAFLKILKGDAMLRRFILARGLLVATALAPPYIVMIAGAEGGAVLGKLGALMLASAAASFASSYVWGRFSDRSSRRVLVAAGLIGALAMASMVALGLVGLAASAWAGPAVLFVLMVAYHGVRQGRSTYLVDLAPEDLRADYAAVANTLIGGILLLAGAVGSGLAMIGPQAALAGFAALSALGGLLCLTLREVESA